MKNRLSGRLKTGKMMGFLFAIIPFYLTVGLPAAHAAVPIACDGDVSGAISANGETDEFTFDGQAGVPVIIRMQGSGLLDPQLELIGPGNTAVASNANNSDGLARIGAPVFILPSNGLYTIRVSDVGNNNTGDYGLSLQFLDTTCGLPINCDADLSGQFTRLAQMTLHHFTAQAGRQVIIRMQGEGLLDPALELYGPQGWVETAVNSSDGLARIGLLTLPHTGTYYLVISDDEGSNFDDYGLSVQFLETTCGLPIACDADLTGQFTRLAQMGLHYFTAQAGRQVIIRMQGEGLLDPALELYGPQGWVETAVNSSDGLARIGLLTLPHTGTYYLVLSDDEGSNFDDYGLSVQFLETTCGLPIACDADLTGQFTRMAQMTLHHFTAQAGQQLIIRMQGEGLLDPALELYGPQGWVETAVNGSDGLARIGLLTLPHTGTYYLVLSDDEGSNFYDYGLSVQFLETSCGLPIGCDADLTGQFTRMAQMTLHHFTAQAGQRLIIRMQGEGLLDPALELYGPQGWVETAVNGSDGLARIGLLTLPHTGTYYLVLSDDEGSNFYDYGLSVQFLETTCGLPIACDADLTGQFTRMAQMTLHHFTAQAGQQLIIRMQGEGLLDPALELYGPQGWVETAVNGSDGLARIGLLTLPHTGTYYLVLSDDEGSNFYDYGLSVQFLDPACSQPINCDAGLTGNLDRLAGADAWRLEGQPGSRMMLQLANIDFLLEPTLELYDASGNLETQITASTNGVVARLDNYPLNGPFPYYLVITDKDGDRTGVYSLNIRLLRTDCTIALDCGGDAGSAIGTVGAMGAYSFFAGQGQKWIFQFQESAFQFEPEILVYRSGDAAYAQTFEVDGLFRHTFTAPAADTFFLVVRDQEGRNTGDYGLSIQLLSPECAAVFSCTQDVSESLVSRAQTLAYRIDAVQGRRVLFRVYGPVIESVLEIYDAGGEPVGTIESVNGRIQWFWTAPSSGPFLVLLRDKTGGKTGAFGFSCQFIDASCEDMVLYCGASVPGNLSKWAETHTYRFSNPAGHRAIVRVFTTSGMELQVEWYDLQTGDMVGGPYDVPGQLKTSRLSAQDEELLLLVKEREGDETGSYRLFIQTVGGEPDCGTALVCGNAAISDQLNLPGELRHFYFEVDPGDRGILRLVKNNNNLNLQSELYGPDHTLIGVNQSRYDFNAGSKQGYFTLLVWDATGQQTGGISLALQRTNDHFCGETVDYNDNRLIHLEQPGVMHGYILEVQAGEVLVTQARGINTTFDAAIEIYDEAGIQLAGDGTSNGLARIDTLRAPYSGTLKLVVMEAEGDETGSMGFSLQKINPGTGGLLPETGQATATLDFPAASHTWSFEGVGGGAVSFEVREIATGISPLVELFGPDGRRLIVRQDNAVVLVNHFSLPEDGIYTVLVMDNDGKETGSYRIGNLLIVADEEPEFAQPSLDAWPNPFSEKLHLQFTLTGKAGVRFLVYDNQGRQVDVSDLGDLPSGVHLFEWLPGHLLPGTYQYRLIAGERMFAGRMVYQGK